MTRGIKLGFGLAALVVLLAAVWYWWSGAGGGIPTLTYETDQTLEGNYSVPQGTKVVVKNGATLTVNGDLLVQGLLTCEGGPLNLVVGGQFKVERTVECSRPDDLPTGDLGNGIVVVAGSFDIFSEAVVASNGHVQLANSADGIAKTQEEIDKLYEEAATYRQDEQHFGPFTTLEQIPAGTPGKPVSAAPSKLSSIVKKSNGLAWFIPAAQAQEPATDIEGNVVPNTNRIGGTWVVGDPTQPLPFDLKIPTPPKGVNKIVLNFNFGANGMELVDFSLTGPDGRAGKDESGKCTVTGGKGEDAMRMLARAGNIKVGNFDLHLGSGGVGGSATTSQDCDPGVATGGAGGSSGNFKMVASDKFEIVGAFNIYPGKGGAGGEATAFGKQGKDGCPGEKGGEARATGGKGGDNKKVLTVSGTVAGTDNITIHEVVGGDGGKATANGGDGGNGTGPKCDGGPGGKATAKGGAGGDTTCAKFPCTGGQGGEADAYPGQGGRGGQGTVRDPGGNGGQGGDAKAIPGKGGAGKAKGQDGAISSETGGDGGNGGDGCNEGKGGKGGTGNPPGKDGVKGKNLCPPPAGAKPGGDAVVPGGEVQPPAEPIIVINQQSFSFNHDIGSTVCPTPIGSLQITGDNVPPGATWRITGGASWLSLKSSGQVGDSGSSLSFNCQLAEYVTQHLSTNLTVTVADASGTTLKQFTVQVQGQVNGE